MQVHESSWVISTYIRTGNTNNTNRKVNEATTKRTQNIVTQFGDNTSMSGGSRPGETIYHLKISYRGLTQ